MRMIKKSVIFTVVFSTALLLARLPATAVAPFRDLAAYAALLAEVDTGTVFFEHNMNKSHPADSLARVVTLLLVIEACEAGNIDPDDAVEITDSAFYNINPSSATLGIQPGDVMTLQDLMYCAYVGNASEACNMIAEYTAGSTLTFIMNMNTYVKGIGCQSTNFTNTNGQFNAMQYTTAADQFIIYREALSHPLFVEISGTLRYDADSGGESESYRLTSQNALLNPNSKYYYRPCNSGITSATFEGGYSIVAFAESEGMSLISIVLGSDAVTNEDESVDMRNLTEGRRLLEWGFSSFSKRTIVSTDIPVGKAAVTHGAGADFVNLRPESSITLLLDNDVRDEDFNRKITVYSTENNETLFAPVNAGDVLGEMTVTRNGVDYGTVLLVASTSIELHRLQFIKMQITDLLTSKAARLIMWALTMLVLGYIALVIRYNILRRRRLQRIAEAKRKLIEERQNQSSGRDWDRDW